MMKKACMKGKKLWKRRGRGRGEIKGTALYNKVYCLAKNTPASQARNPGLPRYTSPTLNVLFSTPRTTFESSQLPRHLMFSPLGCHGDTCLLFSVKYGYRFFASYTPDVIRLHIFHPAQANRVQSSINKHHRWQPP